MKSIDYLLNTLEVKQVVEKIIPFASSEIGKSLIIKARLLKKENLLERINLSQEVYDLNIRHDSLPLGFSFDLEELMDKVGKDGILLPEEFSKLMVDLSISKELRVYLADDKRLDYPKLRAYHQQIKDTSSIIPLIQAVFDNDYNIKDSASPTLKKIRLALVKKQKEINSQVTGLINQYRQYLREGKYYLKGGVFTLPVVRSFKNYVPGLVVDVSDSEQTVFVHPMVLVNIQNEIEVLKGNEKSEVMRILFQLSQTIKPFVFDIIKNNRLIGFFDSLQAYTKYAIANNGHFINLSEEPIISLVEARHPLIDPKKIVPNTFLLDDNVRILVLSGPNAGGKTIALKTIGLLTYMFLCGMPVLCKKGSSISYFQGIFADIGDNQSIDLDLSTFSGHMQNLSEVLLRANHNSLVLLDELGIGTEPKTGEAIALATVEHLEKQRIFSVISSHYQSLKAVALTNERMTVGSFAYDLDTNEPKYHFLSGIPGLSYGLELAKRMKVNDTVILRAREILESNNEYANFETINEQNHAIRKSLEAKEAVLLEKEELLEKKIIELTSEKEKLIVKQKEFDRDYDELVAKKISEVEVELEKLIKEAYLRLEKPHEVIKVKQEVDALKKKHEVEEINRIHDNEPLKQGDYVMVKDLGIHGSLHSLVKNKATLITSDGLTFEVNLKRLEKIEKPNANHGKNVKITGEFIVKSIPDTLNIIGFRVMDAIPVVISFLDQAYAANMKRTKIIHGYGSGQLKKAVRAYLDKSPYVDHYESALDNDGGGGATIVHLR